MTQQNAALVEQATAASQSMADKARDLTNMMSRYDVGDRQHLQSDQRPESASGPLNERRAGDRPFAGKLHSVAKGMNSPASMATASRPKAVASGGDANWREF